MRVFYLRGLWLSISWEWVSAKYTQGIAISLLKFIKSKTTLRRTRKETRERGTVRAEARD